MTNASGPRPAAAYRGLRAVVILPETAVLRLAEGGHM